MASYRSEANSARAAAGSSHAPGTHTRSTSSYAAPASSNAVTAPSASFCVICSLNRLATTAKRRPWAAISPENSATLRGEQVAELRSLRLEIRSVFLRCRRLYSDAIHDTQAISLESDHFARVVRQHANGFQSQIQENLRSNAIVPQIGLETELLVGLDGIRALVLEGIRLEFVEKANAATLLIEVDQHPASRLRDHLHCAIQLPTAVAALRVKDVPGEALRVHPDQHILASSNITEDQRDVLMLIDIVAIPDDAPGSVLQWQPRLGNPMHEPLGAQSIRHQGRHGDERDAVGRRELFEVLPLGHRAIDVHDFANHPGGIESGESCEVHRGLGMSHALQHTTSPRAELVDMPGADQITRHAPRIHRHPNGRGAITRADAGRHAIARGGVNRRRERRAHGLGIHFGLWRKSQVLDALWRQRQANQTAGVEQQEIDHLRRDLFGRADEIALVLAILVIGDQHELAGANVRDRLLDRCKAHDRLPV